MVKLLIKLDGTISLLFLVIAPLGRWDGGKRCSYSALTTSLPLLQLLQTSFHRVLCRKLTFRVSDLSGLYLAPLLRTVAVDLKL